MKEDTLELTLLFDCYSGLLTERQRECFDLHYNQDLSLSEIAENSGISRQGVHDMITRAEQILRNAEVQLGFGKREADLSSAAVCLRRIAAALDNGSSEYAGELRSIAELLEKE